MSSRTTFFMIPTIQCFNPQTLFQPAVERGTACATTVPRSNLLSSTAQCIEAFAEPAGVRFLRLGESFKPFSQFRQSLLARCFSEPWIHFSILVGFTFHR